MSSVPSGNSNVGHILEVSEFTVKKRSYNVDAVNMGPLSKRRRANGSEN